MDLKTYFENTSGLGILSTADYSGQVDAAVYSRPHFMDDGTVAFIMRDRLTHNNLQSNPHAAYLFKEDGEGYAENGSSSPKSVKKKRPSASTSSAEEAIRQIKNAASPNTWSFSTWIKPCPLSGPANEPTDPA
jgi:hypothetical protein